MRVSRLNIGRYLKSRRKSRRPKCAVRVKLIVVDEISMVSSLTLTYMHLRLEELFGGDEWFGCRNMFVGDLLQLQPVNGNPVFQASHKKHFCTN